MGPRSDWFTRAAIERLSSQLWRVTPQSNRVGIRLEGEVPLERCNHDELPSEGTSLGAIQVPASGQPVLFLADHPLTGGYPVIAAVASPIWIWPGKSPSTHRSASTRSRRSSSSSPTPPFSLPMRRTNHEKSPDRQPW